MPNTPILGITQVSASQNQKEVTINDAILALENATNRKLVVSFASASSVLLSDSQATRNMMFEATEATAPATLRIPNTISGQNYNRVIVVRNASGQSLTVKFNTGAGSTVVIPDGEARLLAAMDALNVTVAAQPATTATFLSLSDTPGSYATFAGKALAVNATEDGLEFIDAVSFPAFASNGGKVLALKTDESGVEWVTPVASFNDLADTPGTFTGAGGKLAAVKATEDGIEFIDPPEAEAVEYTPSLKWRIRTILPGLDPDSVGVAEIDFLDRNGLSLVTGGTAVSSTFEVGKEPSYAFDDDLTDGQGWFSEVGDLIDSWVGYEFTTAADVRSVKVWAVPSLTDHAPTRLIIERWDGTAWVGTGEYIPDDWAVTSPQTFKVLGTPLSSVSDAPDDGGTYARQNGVWVDVSERVRDVIGAALMPGTNISITVNDAGDEITINATGASYSDEQARDVIAAALVEVAGIDIIYDDVADTITFTVDLTEIEASASEMWTGASSSKAVTPKNLLEAAAGQALTDGATITIDGNTGFNFRVTLAGNRVLANPTNMKAGQSGVIVVTQDATGGHTLSYGTNWRFPGGAASGGVLSTAANAVDVISYYVRTDGTILANIGKDYKA